jgi:hypothetical protein
VNNFQLVVLELLSDLLVNLSAGFLGAALVIPITSNKIGKIRLTLLLTNILIACLLFASAVIISHD